jgi:LmbE family N-acetylglucosaminyl deacetylase
MKRDVLVVAAHPDDEVLGCGAAMAKHARDGDRVHVLILAEGLTSRAPVRNRKKHLKGLAGLAEACRKAHDILGVTSTHLEAFPDNRMDSVPLLDVIKVVEGHMDKLRPHTVYTHHEGDLNIDHGIAHRAVVTACRPLPGSGPRTLLFFEVPSSTEWGVQTAASAFTPDWFVDATATLDLKLKALKAYGEEMRPWPHPRSIEAVAHLARWRGACSGWEAAEAFMLGRHLSA